MSTAPDSLAQLISETERLLTEIRVVIQEMEETKRELDRAREGLPNPQRRPLNGGMKKAG